VSGKGNTKRRRRYVIGGRVAIKNRMGLIGGALLTPLAGADEILKDTAEAIRASTRPRMPATRAHLIPDSTIYARVGSILLLSRAQIEELLDEALADERSSDTDRGGGQA
jgi:hypothetical protein